jgi:ATP-binding cassette subfamily B protein
MRRYRRLLGYAIPHWVGWLFIVVVTLLSTGFALAQPWPMKILVDQVLGNQAMTGLIGSVTKLLPGTGSRQGLLVWVVLAGLLIFAVNSALDVILTFAWIRVGQQMVYDLAQDLFARLQRRSLLFHSRNSVGDSLSRITGDSWSVHTVVDTLLFAPAHAAITITGMVVVMARLDLRLTLLALAVAPLMTGSSLLLGRPIHAASRARREIESRIQSHVQQILTGIPVVQTFNQEAREHRRFEEFAARALAAQRRSTLASSLSGLGAGSLTTLGTAAILWVAAHQVLSGSLTIGGFLVFLSYLGSLQAQLKVFSSTYSSLQSAHASIDRVLEVLEAAGEEEVREQPGAAALGPVAGWVRLEAVTFGYTAGQPVLRAVSLEARPGETLAIVGPTGAGKSTLVSLIPRLFDPWSGRVLVDGQDVRAVQLSSLRQQVGVVLQEPFLFPLSIAENIAYGRPEASRAEIEAAARAANAAAFIERLPDGYETVVGERGATLSGGERQRLAIARALVKDAPVLILDEPTSALDAETEGLLLEALERLMAGRTTFIIAHRLSTIRQADRIVVVEAGAIVEQGAHAALLAAGGLYARLHHRQFGTVPEPALEAAEVAG